MKLFLPLTDIVPPTTLENLRRLDKLWESIKIDKLPIPEIVTESQERLTEVTGDVVVCGGVLGVVIATALQRQGWRVVIIEKGILQGREQEWNISRKELRVLVELELLKEEELASAIVTEYNPARVSFSPSQEIWVKDVLNIGVSPRILLATLKSKFLAAGGTILENAPLQKTTIHPNGIQISTPEHEITARLLIDAMGHFSPITQQARKGVKPEGVCMVVGSCAQGYPENDSGDLIVSFTPVRNHCQYFWEAFPARDGRTTYLFTYMDAHPQRPSLEFLLREYLELLPEYQQVEISQLSFSRFLFGFFPAYRQGTISLPWDRIVPIGDSAGGQSPVSFGGFGAMLRHLSRLARGIDEALRIDLIDRTALSLLQPYQPNISVTWLFQKAMSIDLQQQIPPQQINNLMTEVFRVMSQQGDDVLKPFLQDVVQFTPLAMTLPRVNPALVLPIISQVGIGNLLDWIIHYWNLAIYTLLYPLGKLGLPLISHLPPSWKYYYCRWVDAFKYGSGADYHE